MESTDAPVLGNGQPPGEGANAPELSPAVAGLRSEMEALQRERDHHQRAIDRISPDLRKYEKAIAILEGRTLGAGGRPVGRPPKDPNAPTGRWANRTPVNTKGIGDEKLERLRAAILQWAEAHEADEFRQVDIRSDTSLDLNSGTMAIGFEKLRQDGFLRLARQSGNNKYFRLTRETLNEQ